MVIFILILATFTNPIINRIPQSYFFQRYPVNVFIEVEEPLPIETIHLISLLTFESLNETFDYKINLAQISAFTNDSVEKYTDEILNQSLWRGSEGGTSSLRWSLKNGAINMRIRAYTGQGPERIYFNKSYNASGISKYGNIIGLFYNVTNDDLRYTNIFLNMKTILHEFGHAFGLKHNMNSSMMYSPEVDLNKTGEPRWPSGFSGSSDSGVVYPYPEGTVEEALKDFNITSISTNPVCYYYESPQQFFNFTSPKYWAPDSPNCTGFLNQSHLWCFQGEYSKPITIVWMDRTLVDTEIGYYWHNYKLEWCTFGLNGFEEFWTDEEILECTGR